MKNYTIGVLIFATFFASLCSCSFSSPENDARKAANKMISYEEVYFKQMKSDFNKLLNGFDSYGFETRVEVVQKIEQIEAKAQSQLESGMAKAKNDYIEGGKKYGDDYTKAELYRQTYANCLNEKKPFFEQEQEILDNICTQINTKKFSIIPPKPDKNKIVKDLVGQHIVGVSGEIFDRGWYVDLVQGQIQDLVINNTESDGKDFCKYDILIQIQYGNSSYMIQLMVFYDLKDYDDWKLERLECKKVDIVKTGRYNDCIEHGLEGWGECLNFMISNKTNSSLLVGGWYCHGEHWSPFLRTILPNKSCNIDWCCTDYKIDFVERP